MTTPTPSDDVKPPEKGSGFWIDKISVENLRHICRNGTATMMLAPLGNCIDAIEDAQARIARLLDHIEAQAVRLDAAVLAEREACAKLCDSERAEFMPQAGANDGRQSDMAFGSVNSAERLASAIRHRAAIASEAKP